MAARWIRSLTLAMTLIRQGSLPDSRIGVAWFLVR